MILIADSGSTKTHWKVLMPDGTEQDFFSQGLNPYHHGDKFAEVLVDAIAHKIDRGGVAQVFFYGAGCAYQSMQDIVALNLRKIFYNASTVDVSSDLMGAARSLFGNGQGLVAVLGTGSNVGFYNGVDLVRHTPSLGYVLGDEGSGAHLGKEFIKRWMYKEFPESLCNSIAHHCSLSIDDILGHVYTSDSPARFLAGFSDIIVRLSSHESIVALIDDCFVKLVERHLLKYSEVTSVSIGAVGSIAVIFENQLRDVLKRYGANLERVMQFPIEGLATFHRAKL